jgi:hypothetical protein
MKIFETFLKCKCGRLKNANYTDKNPIAKATCICGIFLTKEIKACKNR